MIATAFASGFGAAVFLFAAYFAFQEWRSRRCHASRQEGDYRDGSSPFRIVAPAPYQERSEELIVRAARRLMSDGETRNATP